MRARALALPLLLIAGEAHAEALFGYQLGVTQSAGTTITDNAANFAPVAVGVQACDANTPCPGGFTCAGTQCVAMPCVSDAQCQAASPNLVCSSPPNADGTAAGVCFAPETFPVQRLAGLQLQTGVSANVTMDILTRYLDHGFLLGAQFTQLVPAALPDDILAQQRQAVSGFQAQATYLARFNRPSWSIAAGGGYQFGLNGRLDQASGAASGAGAAGDTLPGSNAGPFVINGQTHTINARAQGQITKRDWDLDAQVQYTFSNNGIYTLATGVGGGAANGANNQAAAGGTSGTALGAFVPATTHTIAPQVTFRKRFGQRQNLNANVGVNWLVPVVAEPTEGIPTPQALPYTATTNVTGVYTYSLNDQRSVGVEASSTVSFRVPLNGGQEVITADPNDDPNQVTGLNLDTIIYQGRLVYSDRIRALDLGVNLAVGVAQAQIYQLPLGQQSMRPLAPGEVELNDGDFVFDTPTISNVQPVFAVTLTRRFDPIDLNLGVTRTLGVGGLGASAVTNEAANLALITTLPVTRERNLQLNLGVNASRVRGVDQDLLPVGVGPPPPPPGALPIAVATNNNSLGANVGAQMIFLNVGDLSMDAQASYNFAYNDLDPDGTQRRMGTCNPADSADMCIGLDPIISHTVLVNLRATYGRGPLQDATRGNEREELSSFSQNPRSGSPLVSARLTAQGARMLDGTAGAGPGRPAEERRDSRQAYLQSQRQQKIEEESRVRAQAIEGSKSIQDEEAAAAAAAAKEREEKRETRTRETSPGDWLIAPPEPAKAEPTPEANPEEAPKEEPTEEATPPKKKKGAKQK